MRDLPRLLARLAFLPLALAPLACSGGDHLQEPPPGPRAAGPLDESVIPFAQREPAPKGIVAHGGTLVFFDDTGFNVVADGGTPTAVAFSASVQGVWPAADHVDCVTVQDGYPTSLQRQALPAGGLPTTIATLPENVRGEGFFDDGASLYFVALTHDPLQRTIQRVALSGGAPEAITTFAVTDLTASYALYADGSRVIAVPDRDGPVVSALLATPGAPPTLSRPLVTPTPIGFDGAHVFVAETDARVVDEIEADGSVTTFWAWPTSLTVSGLAVGPSGLHVLTGWPDAATGATQTIADLALDTMTLEPRASVPQGQRVLAMAEDETAFYALVADANDPELRTWGIARVP